MAYRRNSVVFLLAIICAGVYLEDVDDHFHVVSTEKFKAVQKALFGSLFDGENVGRFVAGFAFGETGSFFTG